MFAIWSGLLFAFLGAPVVLVTGALLLQRRFVVAIVLASGVIVMLAAAAAWAALAPEPGLGSEPQPPLRVRMAITVAIALVVSDVLSVVVVPVFFQGRERCDRGKPAE